MNEQERPERQQDESMASEPQNVMHTARGSKLGNLFFGSAAFLFACVILVALILPAIHRPSVPATRSEQLETERRMAVIEQAELEFAASAQPDASK